MATLDVVTLAESKLALNIAASDTAHDTELASYITAVSLALDDLCGPIVQRTVTGELHDGGGHSVMPRRTPVVSVSSVTEYQNTTAQVLSAESNSAKSTNDYLLENDGVHRVVVRRRGSNSDSLFTAGRRNVSLTYVAGRFADTSSVSAKFKQGAAIMLAQLWRSEQGAGTQTFGATELGVPTFAVPNAVRQLLSVELLPQAVA